jgi:SulP family sulfate permease
MEFAGSLGDLGTLLPIAIGMIMINGLNPMGTFVSISILYILSGLYFRVTVPVQPMKIIGAYAIATAMTASQIMASAALLGFFLLIIGGTNAITVLGRYTPHAVIRGVQLATGTLLMAQGVKFIIGSSKFQIMRKMAEPYLSIQTLGPVPIGIIIGLTGGVLTFLLLENKRFPAGLVIVLGGIVLGLVLGTHAGLEKLKPGIYFPEWLPFGIPGRADFTFALFALTLPQLPMTLGNAVIANADLSQILW